MTASPPEDPSAGSTAASLESSIPTTPRTGSPTASPRTHLRHLAPRRARWVTLWLASGAFALGAGEFSSMSLLPSFARDLHVGEGTAGQAISAYALGVVLGAPLIAIFGARLPRKPMLLSLLALFVGGNVISALAPTFGALELGRFIAGIPHGAYFAMAMLLAADLARPEHRARAVSYVSLGLAVATVAGVPTITWAGQQLGWRVGFFIVAALAVVTLVALGRLAPNPPGDATAHPAAEAGALRNPHVLLTLATGAIGFGGMFSVYTYFSAAFTTSGAGPEWAVSPVLMLCGLGVALGHLLAGRLTHGNTLQIAALFQGILAAACGGYALSIGHGPSMALAMLAIGLGNGMTVPLQTRLMDVAGDARTLAAALNHVAFNLANAIGPLLGGVAMAAGGGPASTGWVGVALGLGGLAVLALAAHSPHAAN